MDAELIPQFSNFDDGTVKVVEILYNENDRGLTFNELGWFLQRRLKKDGAHKKYGENHAKLANLLGFVKINNSRPRNVFLSAVGKELHLARNEQKKLIIKNQLLNMALIKDILSNYNDVFDLSLYLKQTLSTKTAVRRMPNIKKLIRILAIDYKVPIFNDIYNAM
ncbi:MAG: hypothetical protein NTY76_00300 [Candidatus Omnitrophica bacterium]|nr:hypothetical protein [Candidatus Omnitrophota bacterium]